MAQTNSHQKASRSTSSCLISSLAVTLSPPSVLTAHEFAICNLQPAIQLQDMQTCDICLFVVNEHQCATFLLYFPLCLSADSSSSLPFYCLKLSVSIITGSVALLQAVPLIYWLILAVMATHPPNTQIHTFIVRFLLGIEDKASSGCRLRSW